MVRIIQKYGGTSVGSVERIQAVAQRVCQQARRGDEVVVVVSAMGHTTDELLALAEAVTPCPGGRELDMLLATGEQVSMALLAMALQALGQSAISLTGAQAGIITQAEHTRARILRINPRRVERHLRQGQVVVVAGFQGVTGVEEQEIITLGRGGSDTSAVALAAALGAERCEIYTDVAGIFTTDPRLVPQARLIPEITSDEMLELASLGAQVLHPRAVEIARNYGITLVVRSSWTDEPGTLVLSAPALGRSLEGLETAQPVDAVAVDPDQAKVALLGVPDRPGVAARLFHGIADHGLDVDLIIQSAHTGSTNDIAFTVHRRDLPQVKALTSQTGIEVAVVPEVAKVSISGAGMIGRPGVAAQMFALLAAAGVNIEMISTSEVEISCVVSAADLQRAWESLGQGFAVPKVGLGQRLPSSAVVRGVALDQQQTRLSILEVPDRPGMAAQICQCLAGAGISVDMIIQSQARPGPGGVMQQDIALTVQRRDGAAAAAHLEQACLGWGPVVMDSQIAKVSIVGAGMVGHPGTAARLFSALAQEQINIQMIATSEIKISCVVPEDLGVKALRAVHRAFGLGG